MSGRHAGTTWKSILGLCDEAEELRAKSRENPESAPATVRSEARRRRHEMRDLLEKELTRGLLANLPGERRLSLDEAEIVAVLLRRYVDPRSPWLTGRELLDRVADDTFSKLRAISLLAPDAPLRASGLMAVERAPRGADPLDARFRLSEGAATLFLDSPTAPPVRRRAKKIRPYRSNREYLLDLRDLAEYCRRRAHAIFGPPDAEGYRPNREERRHIAKKIRSIAARIERDLKATDGREVFPMVQFQNEFALTAEETIVIVDLLFAELFEGEMSLEVVELLQLVSRNEEDLLRRRRMFVPEGALMRRGLVVADDGDDERETTGRVSLARWVFDRILGDEIQGRAIAPDERIDFHLYLKDLNGSARFYRDLASGDENDRGSA